MKNNLKIAFVPSTFLPIVGGAEIQTHNLANIISKKGHQVDIWNTKNGFYEKKIYNLTCFNKIIINFTYILRYYFKIKFNFFLKRYLIKIIKFNKYDIWHFHSLNFKTLIIFELLKELNQKVVITFHGADIQINKKIGYGYRLNEKYETLLKKNLQLVDKVHCISNEIMIELFKLDLSKKKILKLPDCVHAKKFKKITKKKTKKLTLITVARYAEKKKGFDFVDKIASQLYDIIDFEWIIIGRNVTKLKEKKNFFKYKKKIKLIEEINNKELFFPSSKLIRYYKSSDIYAHLSRIESFGITVLEALSSELPVISFNSTGSKTLIKDNINGFIVKNYNTKIYVKKLLKFYYSKKKYKTKINKLMKYDLDYNANKTIKDYRSLLN